MKKAILILLFVFPCFLIAQVPVEVSGWWGGYPDYWGTNFSQLQDTQYFAMDTAAGNLWQIGIPSKSILNTPFPGSTRALITHTDSTYSVGNHSVFEMQFVLHQHAGVEIAIEHMMHADTSGDGGWIEYSLNGAPWKNVVSDPFNVSTSDFYSTADTLSTSGEPGFSGTFVNAWRRSSFFLHSSFIGYMDTLDVRFHFVSDSVETFKDGWMIGNISIWVLWESVNSAFRANEEFRVFPNPATTAFRLDEKAAEVKFEAIEIVDVHGRTLRKFSGNLSGPLNIEGIPPGIYLVRGLRTDDKILYSPLQILRE